MILDVVKAAIGVVGKIVGGDFGAKANDVADALSGEIGQRADVQAELHRHELEMKKLVIEDAEGARQLIRDEVHSEDPFVRRARPAFMWLFYVVIFVNFAVFPVLSLLGVPLTITYPALPEELYWLFGAAFLGYSGLRSWDKKNKTAGNG